MNERPDPWHTPTDAEQIARYQEQSAGTKDYLAREASMTPAEKLEEAVDQFSLRRSAAGWGFYGAAALVALAAVVSFLSWLTR